MRLSDVDLGVGLVDRRGTSDLSVTVCPGKHPKQVGDLLGLQLALGVGSYLTRFSAIWVPGGQITALAMPVAHRLTAALILAVTVVLAVRTAAAQVLEPAGVGPRLVTRLSG